MGEELDIIDEFLSLTNLNKQVVQMEKCGQVEVYVEGDLDKLRDTSNVLLTVHDVGSSYLSWVQVTKHEDAREVRARSVFLHVSVCGQAPDSDELETDFTFPSMQDLGMELVEVLDQLKVKTVVAMGDGAGANIVMRFAMSQPDRVHGVVLVNCSAAAGQESDDRNKMLVTPRFLVGINKLHKEKMSMLDGTMKINTKNVNKFEKSFRKRSDLTRHLAGNISFDTLVITGMKSKVVKDSEEILKEVAAGICSIIRLDDVDDVLVDATDKLVDAIILFCQGLGLLPSTRRRASRTLSVSSQGKTSLAKDSRVSMEQLDQPNVRRLSFTVPPS